MSRYGHYPEYESVAQKREKAKKTAAKLAKKGYALQPVDIEGRRNIVTTFWGKSWCKHLESYIEYSNRLPRGRSYVRHGAVLHLVVSKSHIEAKVSGSQGSMYTVTGKVQPLEDQRWQDLKKQCAGQVGSLVELLQGKLSGAVMETVTDRDTGLFPAPMEISMDCNCPDWVDMCKHNAAVLYGVGVRFDEDPTLLFQLRGVDHGELLSAGTVLDSLEATDGDIGDESLGDIFGIDIETEEEALPSPPPAKKPTRKTKKAPAKKAPAKKAPAKKAPAKRKKKGSSK